MSSHRTAPLRIALLVVACATALAACAESRTPGDLAAAITAVREAETRDLELQQGAALQAAWEGKTFRWTGRALRALCSADERTCAVDIFSATDGASTVRPRHVGGMYPAVQFSDAGWTALHARCLGMAACEVEFEASLQDVRLDPDASIAVRFVEARVVDARPVARRTSTPSPIASTPRVVDQAMLTRGRPGTIAPKVAQAVFGL